MSKQSLVDQSYWDASYQTVAPAMAPQGDALRAWLERHVPRANGEQHALEIGCYPGRYLAVIGQLGYTTHGIDLTPGVERMGPAFTGMGIRTGSFTHADFLTHRFDRHYDLVCSFGFIEHFPGWSGMITRHAELVAPGGLLVLETPNFRGWAQQILHLLLDAVNLRRHHLGAMSPRAWAAQLRSLGFEVVEHGYMGRFEFWRDSPPLGLLGRLLMKAVNRLTPLLRRLPEGSAALSPYCVLIARKASNPMHT